MGFESLVGLFEQTQTAMQTQAARSVDIALVVRNWLFGWYIVEFEQNGTERAEYGSKFIFSLAERLKQLKIKGTSVTRLKLYRSFYKNYQEISPTLSDPIETCLPNSTDTVGRITKIPDRVREITDIFRFTAKSSENLADTVCRISSQLVTLYRTFNYQVS